MRKILILALAAAFIFVALFSAGCFNQPAATRNFFSLDQNFDGQAKSGKKRYSMLVGQISTAAGYENSSMVYKIGENQFTSDFYNEFVAPPSRLLADQVVRFLDAFNGAVQMIKTPGMRPADFGLEAYIEDFYGDYTQSPPQAVVSIKFMINDLRGDSPNILLTETYRERTPIADRNPADLVDGISLCVNRILARLNGDLVKIGR